MVKSRLLHCFLLIALALVTTQVWAGSDFGGLSRRKGEGEQEGASARKRVDNVVLEEEDLALPEVVPQPERSGPGPRERAAPVAATPRPTPPAQLAQKRQDDGQIQALSAQLQSLSESATQAMSSVSSSASSVLSQMSQTTQSLRQSADAARQSADAAVREANQGRDEASRQLSQTLSAASSMSSRMAAELASMESSASSRISAVRVEASASVVRMMGVMSSATAAAAAASSSLSSSSGGPPVSGTTIALIAVASVIVTAIITTAAVLLIMRHRRKRNGGVELASEHGSKPGTAEAGNEKPIAVRGSPPGTPRNFTPWGGATYPMDRMKLPDLSALKKARRATADIRAPIGLATTSYDVGDQNRNSGRGNDNDNDSDSDVGDGGDRYGASSNNFRLQKPNSIERAMSVRVIRVGSGKSSNSSKSGGSDKAKAKAREEEKEPVDEQQAMPAMPQPPPPPPPPPPIPPSPTRPPDAAAAQGRAMSDMLRSSISSKGSEPTTMRESIATRTARTVSNADSSQRYRFRDSSDMESDAGGGGGGAATPNTFGAPRRGIAHRNTGSSHATSAAYGSSLSAATHPPSFPMEAINYGEIAAAAATATARAIASDELRGSSSGVRKDAEDKPPRMPPRSPRRLKESGSGATFAAFPRVRNPPPPKLNIAAGASGRTPPATPPSAALARPAAEPPLTPGSALAAQIRAEAELRGRQMVDAVRLGDDDGATLTPTTLTPTRPRSGGGRRTPKSPRNPNWPFNTGNVG